MGEVGRGAEEWRPQVLDVPFAHGLFEATSHTLALDQRDQGQGVVEKAVEETPHLLFQGLEVRAPGNQRADSRPHRGPADQVDLDPVLEKGAPHTEMGETAGAAST